MAVLPCLAVTGCSDSHSDEYVEFDDLTQTTEDDAESPEATTPASPLVTPAAETGPDEAAPSVAAVSETVVTETVDETASTEPTETPDSEPSPSQPEETAKEPPDATELKVTGEEAKDESAGENRTVEAETPADTEPGAETSPRPIQLLIPHRQFRKEGEALRATFDDIDLLKVLNMQPVPLDAADHFPDWLQQLNGARVRIRGYMRPGFEDEDITEFLFVRDNGECCYGPLPKIYDMIAVQLKEGESTDLIEGTPFDVEGIFRIEPHADEVELFALFFIDDGVITE